MIPKDDIEAWSKKHPWQYSRQVEQDLVISRAIVDIFSDRLLRNTLRFYGGTALHKLFLPQPLRYSQDIDLIRTGAKENTLVSIQNALRPWLGEKKKHRRSPLGPKLFYRFSDEETGEEMILKIEIFARQSVLFDAPQELALKVGDNRWFNGEALVPTYSSEELLAPKLLALRERDQPRDLYDLAMVLERMPNIDRERIVELSRLPGMSIKTVDGRATRAQFQQSLLTKFDKNKYLKALSELVTKEAAAKMTAETALKHLERVLTGFVDLIPGEPWKRYDEKREKIGLSS